MTDEEFISYLKETYRYDEKLKGLVFIRFVRPKYYPGMRAGSKHPNGYWYIKVKGKPYKEHRLVFALFSDRMPKGEVDHIDRDLDNNSFENLREATRSENCANRRSWGPTSKYRGVSLHAKTGKFQATVRHLKKNHYLGLYETEEEAAKAVDVKAKELRGDAAQLNFQETTQDVQSICPDSV